MSTSCQYYWSTQAWHLWLPVLVRLSIIWTWFVLGQVSVLRTDWTHKDHNTHHQSTRAVICLLPSENGGIWDGKNHPAQIKYNVHCSFTNCPLHCWCHMITARHSLLDFLINPTWPSFWLQTTEGLCPLHFHKYTSSFPKYVTKHHLKFTGCESVSTLLSPGEVFLLHLQWRNEERGEAVTRLF